MQKSIALITGASSGIGKAYARLLASKGFHLILVARREEQLEKLAREIEKKHQVRAEILVADLSGHEGVNKIIESLKRGQQPEVLVHAAGFGTRGFVAEISPELLEQQVYLHNVAAVVLARAVLPSMKVQKKGALIFISSVAAFISTAEYTVYSSTKVFLNTFVTGLRDELAGTDIKVQAVCPGITRTEFMFTEIYKEHNFDYSFIPGKFWMEPEEVVEDSWNRLTRRYRPIIVSGKWNKAFVRFLNFPLIGSLMKIRISKSVRKKVAKGLPVGF